MSDGYEIWAVECGYVPRFPRAGIHAFVTDGSTTEVPFGFVACRDEERVVLVDCGFDLASRGGAERAAARSIVGWRPMDELLAALGLAASEVTDVILTHAHWDHAGGLGSLPNATVHIQARELAEWERLLGGPPAHRLLLEAIDAADVEQLVALAASGRLRLHDGDVEAVVPGIDLVDAADTHTPGSQCVVITDRAGLAHVAAGDCVMSRQNLTGLVPGAYSPIAGIHGSRERLFHLYDRLLSLVDGAVERVIAVHDAATWAPSSRPGDGVRLARLDVDP